MTVLLRAAGALALYVGANFVLYGRPVHGLATGVAAATGILAEAGWRLVKGRHDAHSR